MEWFRIEPAPVREAVTQDSKGTPLPLNANWMKWFPVLDAFLLALSPSVRQDVGNADSTLTWGTSAKTHVYGTPITAGRTITLSTTKAVSGAEFHIVRTAAATGAFNVDVGGLKNLAVGQWCRVAFNGTAWFLSAFGSL